MCNVNKLILYSIPNWRMLRTQFKFHFNKECITRHIWFANGGIIGMENSSELRINTENDWTGQLNKYSDSDGNWWERDVFKNECPYEPNRNMFIFDWLSFNIEHTGHNSLIYIKFVLPNTSENLARVIAISDSEFSGMFILADSIKHKGIKVFSRKFEHEHVIDDKIHFWIAMDESKLTKNAK